MSDHHYPKVSKEFILECLRNCSKIDNSTEETVGDTTLFLLVGDQPIYKRSVRLVSFDGEVNYEQATALAARLSFMRQLLDWYIEHKQWKDGAYIISSNLN